MFDVIGKRRWFFLFSALITIPGLIFIVLTPLTNGQAGLQFSIDYTGGTAWEIKFQDPNVTSERLKSALATVGVADATVVATSEGFYEIRSREVTLPPPAVAEPVAVGGPERIGLAGRVGLAGSLRLGRSVRVAQRGGIGRTERVGLGDPVRVAVPAVGLGLAGRLRLRLGRSLRVTGVVGRTGFVRRALGRPRQRHGRPDDRQAG